MVCISLSSLLPGFDTSIHTSSGTFNQSTRKYSQAETRHCLYGGWTISQTWGPGGRSLDRLRTSGPQDLSGDSGSYMSTLVPGTTSPAIPEQIRHLLREASFWDHLLVHAFMARKCTYRTRRSQDGCLRMYGIVRFQAYITVVYDLLRDFASVNLMHWLELFALSSFNVAV